MTPSPTTRAFPAIASALLCAATSAQHPTAAPSQSDDAKKPMYVAKRSEDGKASIQALQLAPGLQASLVASEPDLCNVVAFSIDEQGRAFVSETFRIHDGVFDTREYMRWKDDDLALRTVEERVRKYEKHIANDIPKYASYSERIKLLIDENNDFVFDKSVVFADGFAELADGIASGVLRVGKDVWFANIPKLWRIVDADGDGAPESREAVFDGFGVHTSLIGHDLHGLLVGPDRRLYVSIGDRGFSTRTKEGELLDFETRPKTFEGKPVLSSKTGQQLEDWVLTFRVDEAQRLNVLTGNVDITKGTMAMAGPAERVFEKEHPLVLFALRLPQIPWV
jgi:quinoprotein glucose dehydrogenase